MRSLTPPLLAACALAWGVALAAGGLFGPAASSSAPVEVVATTTEVTDLVRHVAAGRARVVGLLPPNADPHEHEVRPSDVQAVSAARLVVRSGGDVDTWMTGALDAAGGHARVLDLSRSVRLRGDDPHWWQDPRNAVLAVEAIRAALTRADPAGAATYRAAADVYAQRLRRLDAAIARCWSAVPLAQRRLVTTHDAYGYYAHRYGLQVVGAVIPALTSQAQPSPRDLARLVATIRRDRIRAIFTERALNKSVERAVAREAGATIGRPLSGDTLGPPGSDWATYTGALASDTHALVDGLAGHHVPCALP
jgi:ABC-type Zn uptake system ZnuABC Zn-binding protein ZnuA